MSLSRRLISRLRKRSSSEKLLIRNLKICIGYTPINLSVFQIALLQTSGTKEQNIKVKESYERMEYLGDAVLGAVVADYLFKKYPFKSEGFLTNIRSRIVSRESLNAIARKMGLQKLIMLDKIQQARMHKSIYGNTLEALIAAVYLDRGYRYCWKFIMRKVILPNVDITHLVDNDLNFKSKIIEWAQKGGKDIRFATIDVENNANNTKQFTVNVVIDNEIVSVGYGTTKKKAEQDGSFKACQTLEID